MQRGLGGLWRKARCSSGLERHVHKFGGGFTVFEALGDHSKSKGLNTGDGLVTVYAVTHHASKARHLGQPSAVIFPFEFNRKSHVGTVTSGPAVQQPNGADTPNGRCNRVTAARGSFGALV